MSRMLHYVILLICVNSLIHLTSACSCFPMTFKQRLCHSTTTLRARILTSYDNCVKVCDPIEDQVNGTITYIAQIEYVYRGLKATPGTPLEHGVMYLNTAVNGALCGINLDVGETYILHLSEPSTNSAILGETSQKSCSEVQWSIGLCSHPVLWSTLSEQEREVLQELQNKDDVCKDEVDMDVAPVTVELDPQSLSTPPPATTPTANGEDLEMETVLPRWR